MRLERTMAIFTIDDISDSTEARFWAKVDKRGRDDCICTICDICRAIESALRAES